MPRGKSICAVLVALITTGEVEAVWMILPPSTARAGPLPLFVTERFPHGEVVPTASVPKYPVPDAVRAVDEAYVAVSLALVESKVRPALSVKAPAVVRNGMRVVVKPETIKLVELAVP